jgi:hypothetical protein
MTATATKLVDEFRQLEPSEQRWVRNEILHLAGVTGPTPLTDDELTALADQTFVLLDQEEEVHAPAR